jgi:hypothetical protein
MLRGAREEEAKLLQRRRSGSFAESSEGGISEEDEPDGRARGLSRSLEVSTLNSNPLWQRPPLLCWTRERNRK